MNHDETYEFTPHGAARRDRMLDELLDEMRQHHRRRRKRRRAAWIAIPVISAGAVISLWISSTTNNSRINHEPMMAQHEPPLTNDAAGASNVVIVRVMTDSSIIDRYRAASAPRAMFLTDDDLLKALAAIDISTGLIRSQGRVWLTNEIPAQHPDPADAS